MSLLICGDLVPTDNNESLFNEGKISELLGNELLKIWEKSDYKIFNLECPMTDSHEKLIKCGPNLKCSPKSINGLNKLNPALILLANNHILDYSDSGLNDTINILDNNNINWIGVGKNINELKKSYTFNVDNQRIAIYNCCEHEFCIATDESSGANPFDWCNIDNDLKKLKKMCDYLIVVYHGGKEHYRYPSPLLQKKCHKMVEYGADLIICQHSHCIGCMEEYNKSTIIYGQGNFIFNMNQNEYWNNGLILDIKFDNNKAKIDYIPIIQTKYGIRIANENEKKEILNDFYNRSKKIQEKNFVEHEYTNYSSKLLNEYIIRITGNNFLFRIIKKITPKFFNLLIRDYTIILNTIECESHNELMICSLKNKLNSSSIRTKQK